MTTTLEEMLTEEEKQARARKEAAWVERVLGPDVLDGFALILFHGPQEPLAFFDLKKELPVDGSQDVHLPLAVRAQALSHAFGKKVATATDAEFEKMLGHADEADSPFTREELIEQRTEIRERMSQEAAFLEILMKAAAEQRKGGAMPTPHNNDAGYVPGPNTYL